LPLPPSFPQPLRRAAAIHLGVANSLATEVTAKRGKRRKLWE
jgi:hypothetical protein